MGVGRAAQGVATTLSYESTGKLACASAAVALWVVLCALALLPAAARASSEPLLCGKPAINFGADRAGFLWRDCQDGSWRLDVSPGRQFTEYRGAIEFAEPLIAQNAISVESTDSVTLNGARDRLSWILKVSGTRFDAIRFQLRPQSSGCFTLTQPAGLQIFGGRLRQPLGRSFDVVTGAACGSFNALPALSASGTSAVEVDGQVLFELALNAPFAQEVRVDYASQDATAVAGDDYVAVAGQAVFSPGETRVSVAVDVIDDGIAEGSETFGLRLSNPVNATLAGANPASATIWDDALGDCGEPAYNPATDSGLYLYQSCADGSWVVLAVGGGQYNRFRGRIESAAPFAGLSVAGVESNDLVDNATNPLQIDFDLAVTGAGTDSFTFAVDPAASACVQLIAPDPANFLLGTAQSPLPGTFDLITRAACDAASRPPLLTAANASVLEGAGQIEFALTLSRASDEPVSLLVSTVDVTATAGADYLSVFDELVEFAAGVTTQPFVVTVLEDQFAEPPEGFGLVFSAPINVVLGSQGEVFGTVIDNDQAVPQVSLTDGSFLEGSGTYLLRASTSIAATDAIEFSLQATSGTAIVGSDVVLPPGPFVLAPGQTELLIPVQVIDDSLLEDAESFTVELINVIGASPASDALAQLTIIDNDAPVCGRPGINAATDSAIFVFLDCGSGLWHVEAVGGGRFTAFRGSVTADLALQNPQGLNIEASDLLQIGDPRDLRFEFKVSGQGRDILRFRAPAAARVCFTATAPNSPLVLFGPNRQSMPASFDVTTEQACGQPDLVLNLGPAAASEGDGALVFPVTLSAPAPQPVTFRARTGAGTAVPGADYLELDSLLTLAVGQLATQVPVALVDDTLRESLETLSLTLSELVNADAGVASATGEIADDDPQPTLLPPTALVIAESATTGAELTFTLTNAADQLTRFRLQSEPGTATQGLDYLALDEMVEFPAQSLIASTVLNVVDDDFAEGDETLLLRVTAPDGLTIAQATVPVTLIDDLDDSSLLPSIDLQLQREFSEAAGSVPFLVTLGAPSAVPVEVQVGLRLAGSASAADVQLLSGPTLVIPAGELQVTVELLLVDDGLFEAPEQFVLEFANPVNAALATTSATITLLDDDAQPVLSLLGNETVTEGPGALLNFTAQLDQPSGRAVDFEIVAVGGTATQDEDYRIEPTLLTIAPGVTSMPVVIEVLDDNKVEGSEELLLTLGNVVGASPVVATVPGTINDDEGLPSIAIAGPSCRLEGEADSIALTLSNPSAQPVSVRLSTGAGSDSATPLQDFLPQDRTLVEFAPGQVLVEVPLNIVNDAVTEGLETLSLLLTEPVNGAIESAAAQTFTLVDDDLAAGRKSNPGHYISMRRVDGDAEFVDALRPGVAGIQKRYSWAQLEPEMDAYRLEAIRHDLDVAACNDAALVVFLEDKTFAPEPVLPAYLIAYAAPNDAGGTSPLRWEPIFVERFNALVTAIANAFDEHPAFEGIALQETAPGLAPATLSAVGYTAEAYRSALTNMLTHAAQALPRSHVFWYMNFFPGNQGYIVDIANAVAPLGVAVGGPDVLPDDPALQQFTYPLYDQIDQTMTRFGSMQFDSYAHPHARNAPTRFWTPAEIFAYARDQLAVRYLFWNRKTWKQYPDSYRWLDALPVIEANPVFNP